MLYQLRQSLNTFQILMIALGASWGNGIILTSFYAKELSSASIVIIYIFGLLLMYFVMTVLRELSIDYPSNGSFVEYSYQYLNQGVSFIIGWCAVITFTMIAFVYSVILAHLLQQFIHVPAIILSIALIVIFSLCNLLSINKFATIQSILATIKIILLFIFNIALAFSAIKGYTSNHSEINTISVSSIANLGSDDIFRTLLLLCFAFTGLEYISITGGESKKPQRSIAIALKYFFLVVLFGLSLTSISIILAPQQSNMNFLYVYDGSYHINVFKMSEQNVYLLELLYLVASFATLNSAIYASSRILLSLARNAATPAKISIINHRGIPRNAVLTVALIVLGYTLLFYVLAPGIKLISITLFCIVFFITLNWLVILFIYIFFYRSILNKNGYLVRMCVPAEKIIPPNKTKLILSIFTIFCILAVLMLLLLNPTFKISFSIMMTIIVVLGIVYALKNNTYDG